MGFETKINRGGLIRRAASELARKLENPLPVRAQAAVATPLVLREIDAMARDSTTARFYGKTAEQIRELARRSRLEVRWGLWDGGCCAYASPGWSQFGDRESAGDRLYLSAVLADLDPGLVRHELRHWLHRMAIEDLFRDPATAALAQARLGRLIEVSGLAGKVKTPEAQAALGAFEATSPGDLDSLRRLAGSFAALAYQGLWAARSPAIEAIASMSDGGLVYLSGWMARLLERGSPAAGYNDRGLLNRLMDLPPIDRFLPIAG